MSNYMQEILLRSTIPVVINVFNQISYTKQMIESLENNGFKSIVIINQASEYKPLIDYINFLSENKKATILNLSNNEGPHWFFRSMIYECMPNPIIYSDPDISLPQKLDNRFCTKLIQATEKYKVAKAGCAIDISDSHKFKNKKWTFSGKKWSAEEWERQFWQRQIDEGIYDAGVDTTFHLFNKTYFNQNNHEKAVRVSGDGITVKHIPWYVDDMMTDDERDFYTIRTKSSTWI